MKIVAGIIKLLKLKSFKFIHVLTFYKDFHIKNNQFEGEEEPLVNPLVGCHVVRK